MSRDPLEELFGPLDSDDTETGAIETDEIAASGDANTSAPTRAVDAARPSEAPAVPGVRAPRQVPAEAAPTAPLGKLDPAEYAPAPASSAASRPVPARPAAAVRAPRTAREELPTQPVPAKQQRSNTALPWIIVAAVAVLALVGALLVVNSLRDDDPKPEETSEAAPTPAPTPGEETTTAPEPTPEEPEEPEVPVVDVGPNPISMPISFAGISVESSQKLTSPQWFYHAGPPERVMFESGLMNSFPDSCAAMRSPVGQSPWGIEKGEDDTWTVVRPEGTCAADPELYDEVWGLMQAVADSAKPL